MKATRFLRFPIARRPSPLDRLVLRTSKGLPGFCLVCGRLTVFAVRDPNFREDCVCVRCRSFNRQRQLAYVVCAGLPGPRSPRSFAGLASGSGLRVYNTESSRAVHETLKAMPGYQSSEYFNPERRSGDVVDGVMHQDLENLSFADGSFDLVLSGDVFEHVPYPYRAHAEVYRVLRPNGRHVFTVPFHQQELQDDVRAEPGPDGRPKLLKEAIYHLDAVHPEGALVYTIFGLEMLVNLSRIGFRTNLYHLYKPWFGILGLNAIVFEAVKPA